MTLGHMVRQGWDAAAARFGQATALSNARYATTRLLRQRVEREDVRIYLDRLDEGDGLDAASEGDDRAAAGSEG